VNVASSPSVDGRVRRTHEKIAAHSGLAALFFLSTADSSACEPAAFFMDGSCTSLRLGPLVRCCTGGFGFELGASSCPEFVRTPFGATVSLPRGSRLVDQREPLFAQRSTSFSLPVSDGPKMNLESENCQNEMLNAARKERKRVAVFLVNGIKLVGFIESYDRYLIILSSTAGSQAVYKHAISTIQEDTGKAREAASERTRSAPSRSGGVQRTTDISHKRRRTTD
jgi:host factor-I protein